MNKKRVHQIPQVSPEFDPNILLQIMKKSDEMLQRELKEIRSQEVKERAKELRERRPPLKVALQVYETVFSDDFEKLEKKPILKPFSPKLQNRPRSSRKNNVLSKPGTSYGNPHAINNYVVNDGSNHLNYNHAFEQTTDQLKNNHHIQIVQSSSTASIHHLTITTALDVPPLQPLPDSQNYTDSVSDSPINSPHRNTHNVTIPRPITLIATNKTQKWDAFSSMNHHSNNDVDKKAILTVVSPSIDQLPTSPLLTERQLSTSLVDDNYSFNQKSQQNNNNNHNNNSKKNKSSQYSSYSDTRSSHHRPLSNKLSTPTTTTISSSLRNGKHHQNQQPLLSTEEKVIR
jgi:hypothetical protein